jgi:hypothetical protein
MLTECMIFGMVEEVITAISVTSWLGRVTLSASIF